jgi:hypothetical protein
MSLLVVVGHPYLLYTDTYWRELVDFCLQHASYWGPPCSLFPDAHNQREDQHVLQPDVKISTIRTPENDEEELLNTAAKLTLLEAGVVDIVSDSLEEYYRQDIVWRNLL